MAAVSTTSCGACVLYSRLPTAIALELELVRARLTGPPALTSGVTSIDTQPAESDEPELPTAPPNAGALLHLIERSSQLVSATDLTVMPALTRLFT